MKKKYEQGEQGRDKVVSNGLPLEIDNKRPVKVKMVVPKTKKGKKTMIMFIL